MKRFFFAVAVVALVASVGSAEDKPAVIAPAPVTPAITTATPTPVVEYAPAQPQRRGLLARLRNRNNSTYYSTTPQMVVPATPAAPMPMPGIAPQPMPTVRPTGAVIPATGNLPPGRYTTTDGTIIQIGGPATAGPVMTTGPVTTAGYTYTEPTTTTRRGLFSRLRR